MIVATLGIRVSPENEEQAVRIMLPMLGPTRAESGCVSCDLYQSLEDDRRLMLLGRWESLADLQLQRPLPLKFNILLNVSEFNRFVFRKGMGGGYNEYGISTKSCF